MEQGLAVRVQKLAGSDTTEFGFWVADESTPASADSNRSRSCWPVESCSCELLPCWKNLETATCLSDRIIIQSPGLNAICARNANFRNLARLRAISNSYCPWWCSCHFQVHTSILGLAASIEKLTASNGAFHGLWIREEALPSWRNDFRVGLGVVINGHNSFNSCLLWNHGSWSDTLRLLLDCKFKIECLCLCNRHGRPCILRNRTLQAETAWVSSFHSLLGFYLWSW